MKTKTIEVCDAKLYSISCERNDPIDIRCGGSAVLGYDFGVSPDEDEKKIIEFLKSCIKKYHRPFIGISVSIQKDFPVKHLWTKERMEECIKNNAI
jgi:hypothetical protein